jgi:hypothetical protein
MLIRHATLRSLLSTRMPRLHSIFHYYNYLANISPRDAQPLFSITWCRHILIDCTCYHFPHCNAIFSLMPISIISIAMQYSFHHYLSSLPFTSSPIAGLHATSYLLFHFSLRPFISIIYIILRDAFIIYRSFIDFAFDSLMIFAFHLFIFRFAHACVLFWCFCTVLP